MVFCRINCMMKNYTLLIVYYLTQDCQLLETVAMVPLQQVNYQATFEQIIAPYSWPHVMTSVFTRMLLCFLWTLAFYAACTA